MAAVGKEQRAQLMKVVYAGLLMLVSVGECAGQLLQPDTRCFHEPNVQEAFVSAGIAQLRECGDSFPGQYEYHAIFGNSGSERSVSIQQYLGHMSHRANTLYWFENSPKTFYLKATNMQKLGVDELPGWALKIISENRGYFNHLIAGAGLPLPPVQDDPKARGRSARVQ